MSLFYDRPILAIESSCDETSAAVVEGVTIRSNIVSSQVELHKQWGGVVPEAAARAHVEAVLPVIEEALSVAGVAKGEIGAVAVTNRPGLIGALSVGVCAAKALAFAFDIPLLGIHHLEGHLLSPLASVGEALPFPHTCLIVSGGHTELVVVHGFGDYRIVGQTRDDAAGEAFDKGARLLGLGYPGGKAIQDAAAGGSARYKLPQGLSGETIDFSFSGLKTAMLRLVQAEGTGISVPDAAASLQETIVSVLTERAIRAALEFESRALSLVGGVAANLSLRERMRAACEQEGIAFLTPPVELCTDNAAMIGLAASVRLARGERDSLDLDCFATSEIGTKP